MKPRFQRSPKLTFATFVRASTASFSDFAEKEEEVEAGIQKMASILKTC